jgi:tRNA(Arg) A34 adenosine deaminase TadA
MRKARLMGRFFRVQRVRLAQNSGAAHSRRARSAALVSAIPLIVAFHRTGSKETMQDSANPEFLRRTIRLATDNVLGGAGGPFGAVIVRDGKILAEGVNTVTAAHDPTAHAEVNAIRVAAKALGAFSLSGCQLYTSCEPCPMCLAAAYWARIEAIYYGASAADAARAGFDDAFLYREFRKDKTERSLPATQLLGDEAWSSFAAWIASVNKIEY